MMDDYEKYLIKKREAVEGKTSLKKIWQENQQSHSEDN